MATAQVHNGSPSPSLFAQPHAQQNSPAPASRMYDLPTELTTAQLEAKTILAHLLGRLKETDSKCYPRYGKWAERHPKLEEFIFRSVRPQVWTFLQGRWSLDALKLVGGDLRYEGRGIYLDGVLGLDKRVRVYVGQSINMRQRVAQHLNFRYRRDNPSLHYHAMQNSVYNTIGALVVLPSPNMGNMTLPGMDDPGLLLNVVEMWMCLVFRTLPEQMLEEWLPGDGTINTARKEGKEGVFGGLNIACPLNHGEREREWIDLSESDDALIRSYLLHGTVEAKNEEGRKRSDVRYVKKEEEEKYEDSLVQRKKKYAEKARGYRNKAETEIRVPQWMLFGTLAAMVGFLLLNSKGGPQPRGRWR
ncbi:hypothetical protein EJ02DRAFT_452413 [Clathrospora elynae]|uniref:GIY-YIG domain-containing protein n=1 Tax=Clathrospora elynae TaxID=706981 RepID=A0A6A5SWE9_9PLEO|nr:hypothetical protein EJ02DRAFT_452413 [Clathrospora elynae]